MLVKLTVLGSGSFVPTLNRGQSGYLLETEKSKVLVDAGITVPQALEKFFHKKVTEIVPELNAILISHQHADHIGGLVTLIGAGLTLYYFGLSKKVPKVDIFLPEYSNNLRGDIEHQFPEIKGGFENFFSLKNFSEKGSIIDLSPEIRVRIEKVEHSRYFSCFGFRFTVYDEMTIAYSGDTQECEGLYRLLSEPTPVDLAIIEVGSLPEGGVIKQHLNVAEAGRIAEECKVKELVLTHISFHHSREEIFEEASKEYTGKLFVAEDGQTFILE